METIDPSMIRRDSQRVKSGGSGFVESEIVADIPIVPSLIPDVKRLEYGEGPLTPAQGAIYVQIRETETNLKTAEPSQKAELGARLELLKKEMYLSGGHIPGYLDPIHPAIQERDESVLNGLDFKAFKNYELMALVSSIVREYQATQGSFFAGEIVCFRLADEILRRNVGGKLVGEFFAVVRHSRGINKKRSENERGDLSSTSYITADQPWVLQTGGWARYKEKKVELEEERKESLTPEQRSQLDKIWSMRDAIKFTVRPEKKEELEEKVKSLEKDYYASGGHIPGEPDPSILDSLPRIGRQRSVIQQDALVSLDPTILKNREFLDLIINLIDWPCDDNEYDRILFAKDNEAFLRKVLEEINRRVDIGERYKEILWKKMNFWGYDNLPSMKEGDGGGKFRYADQPWVGGEGEWSSYRDLIEDRKKK